MTGLRHSRQTAFIFILVGTLAAVAAYRFAREWYYQDVFWRCSIRHHGADAVVSFKCGAPAKREYEIRLEGLAPEVDVWEVTTEAFTSEQMPRGMVLEHFDATCPPGPALLVIGGIEIGVFEHTLIVKGLEFPVENGVSRVVVSRDGWPTRGEASTIAPGESGRPLPQGGVSKRQSK